MLFYPPYFFSAFENTIHFLMCQSENLLNVYMHMSPKGYLRLYKYVRLWLDFSQVVTANIVNKYSYLQVGQDVFVTVILNVIERY